MIVDGYMHFKFIYRFVGQEQYVHEVSIYAEDAEKARNQFSVYMINAPKYEVVRIEVVETM